MAILRHVEATGDERAGYLKMRRAVTGEQANGAENGDAAIEAEDETASAEALSMERYTEMSAQEQFILTISEKGFGKRTSSYEYRITGRGGKGITAMAVNARNGALVASFPVENEDQIMLVTDGGQLIRVPVDGIRIVGRGSQGVTVFSTKGKEKVVSVEHIEGEDAEEGGDIDLPDGGDASDGGEGA
jgi:DNA gyrase subunit A